MTRTHTFDLLPMGTGINRKKVDTTQCVGMHRQLEPELIFSPVNLLCYDEIGMQTTVITRKFRSIQMERNIGHFPGQRSRVKAPVNITL